MLKEDQFFIAAADSFISNKSGHERHFNVLQVVHYDQYDKLKAEAIFTSEAVVNQFTGSGIYQVSTVYGKGITAIKKISSFEL